MPFCDSHRHQWCDTDIGIGINVLRPMSKVIDIKKPLQIRGDSNQTLNNKEDKLSIHGSYTQCHGTANQCRLLFAYDISWDLHHVFLKTAFRFKSSPETRLCKVLTQLTDDATTDVNAPPGTQSQSQIASCISKEAA